MKTIENVKICDHYELTFNLAGKKTGSGDIILVNSRNEWELLVNAFNFGYAQGTKAEKAAPRRKRIANY